jgi:hypothetical protein
MTKVRVLRISAVNDPFSGQPAKQIELAEVRDRGGTPPVYGAPEDTKVVQSIISQFQSMGFMPQVREFSFPKISMVLTESEYDMLGIRLDVNEVYDLDIRNGSITLRKSTEGT